MKLKTAKIIVESKTQTSERWVKALKGKLKQSTKEEVISVGSWEILGKIFTPLRLQILATIIESKPKSIAELAKLVKKDFKNVHSDVHFLADVGLLELKAHGKNKKIAPVAKFGEIELPFVA